MAFFLWLLMVSLFASGLNKDEKPSCQCVPSNLCRDNDAAVNGQGLLDIRTQNALCENRLEVCCENIVSEPDVPSYSTYKGCGLYNPNLKSRITSNSKNTEFAELPWTVVLILRDVARSERNIYRCGGSLIHPQIVLTAAHCVFQVNADFLTVRAGEWNTKSQEEPFPHQDRTVNEILIHSNFHSGTLKNDIALLFLTEPFMLTTNIGVICLPPQYLQLENTMCTVGGWGKDTWKKGKHSTILKKIELPLVPTDECVSALRKTKLGFAFELHKSFVCAGGESNKDTCKGDGGSPLVCPIPGKENRLFQMGIVSWGIGCGENGIPGVYVNIPLFSGWIDDALNARNYGTSFYKY